MNSIVVYNAEGQTDSGIFVERLTLPPGASASAWGFRQWGLGLTLSGRCYRHQNAESILEAGDLTLTLPETEIAWRVPDTDSWRVIYIIFYPRPHWHCWLTAFEFQNGFARLRVTEPSALARIKRDLMGVLRTYTQAVSHRDELTLLNLERVLLTMSGEFTGEKAAVDQRIREAMHFIESHYARPLTNSAIAKAAHTSISHLRYLFTQRLRVTPMQYLIQLRLQHAAQMLQFTNADIHEVMLASGFRDAAYFSNCFRRYNGQSPRAFRAAKRRG